MVRTAETLTAPPAMNNQAFIDSDLAGLNAPTGEAANTKRRWWHLLRRGNRPRRLSRQTLLEEMHSEHRRLVETLERIGERLEGPADKQSAFAMDPMPVFEGIRHLTNGQKEVSTAIRSLNTWVERSTQTDAKLMSAVSKVDETLGQVRSSQDQTVTALDQVGQRLLDSTKRFEAMFQRMQASEARLAEEYRTLQRRTVYAVAGIGVTVVTLVGLFLGNSWG